MLSGESRRARDSLVQIRQLHRMRFTFLQLKAYFLSRQKGSSCHLSRQANVDQNKKACNPVDLIVIYNFSNSTNRFTSNTSQNCQRPAPPEKTSARPLFASNQSCAVAGHGYTGNRSSAGTFSRQIMKCGSKNSMHVEKPSPDWGRQARGICPDQMKSRKHGATAGHALAQFSCAKACPACGTVGRLYAIS